MAEVLFGWPVRLAIPFWALMILAPHWRWTRRVVGSPLIVLPSLVIYTLLVLTDVPTVARGVLGNDLGPAQALLGSSLGAAVGWTHFIGLDLFAGRWMYLDSRELDVHPVLMAPVFVLTFLFAPAGLLSYLLLREVRPLRRARSGASGTRPRRPAPRPGSSSRRSPA